MGIALIRPKDGVWDNITQFFDTKLNNAQKNINSAVHKSKSAAKNAFMGVENKAENFVKSSVNEVENTAKYIVTEIKTNAKNTTENVSSFYNENKEVINDPLPWLGNKIDKTVQKAEKKVDAGRKDIVNFGENKFGDTGKIVGNVISGGIGFVEGECLALYDVGEGTANLLYNAGQVVNPFEWYNNPDDNIERLNTAYSTVDELLDLADPTQWTYHKEENLDTAEALWDGITDGYQQAAEQGDLAKLNGRLAFDVASLFVGVGEVKAALKGSKAATKAVSVSKAADDVPDITKSLDDIGDGGKKVTKNSNNIEDGVNSKNTKGRPKVEPGGHNEKYNTFKTNDDVPSKYSKDNRFDDLASDPDHAGKIDSKSRQEAMAGLEAERQGLIQKPIQRGPKGIEYYDGDGVPWDVKGPVSPPEGAKWKFNAKKSGESIIHELRKPDFPNYKTGLLEKRKVILDSTYMNKADHKALMDYVNQNATKDELSRIVEVVSDL